MVVQVRIQTGPATARIRTCLLALEPPTAPCPATTISPGRWPPLGRPRPVSGQPVSTCDHCLAGTTCTDVHLPVTLVLYVVGRPLTAESSGSVAGGGLGSGPSSDVASCPLLRPSALCLGSGPLDSPISMHRYEPMVSTLPALRGPSSPWRRVTASRCA